MFLDELTPLMREFAGHPAAFLGGLASGLLRLNLSDDPVKSWLEKQGIDSVSESKSGQDNSHNGGGPQSISIE